MWKFFQEKENNMLSVFKTLILNINIYSYLFCLVNRLINRLIN